MEPDDNRAIANLLLLCIEHSYTVDDPALEAEYPADLLRDWKSAQLAEYQKLHRAWPISDDDVADVIEASFATSAPHINLRIDIAQAAGTLIAGARRGRAIPASEVAKWRATWDRANATAFAYDEDGNRLPVHPSRVENDTHRDRLSAALAAASDEISKAADRVKALVGTASAELPELRAWLDHVNRCTEDVEAAIQRWPIPPPFGDDSVLDTALAELTEAVEALIRRWKGNTGEPPPPTPERPAKPAESPAQQRHREHWA
jgi:hypothetical protein